MNNVTRLICEAIHVNFPAYFANYPPNIPIKIGDIGNLRNTVFTHESNLKARFGIDPGNETNGKHGNLKFNHGASVAVVNNFQIETQPLPNVPQGDAGVSINFSSANGILFSATGCYVTTIEDKIGLGEQIIRLFEADKWDPNWVVVTSVIESGNLHLYLSAGENASVSLKAKANTGATDLFDAGINTELVSESQIATKFVGEKGTIPIIGLSKLSKSLFGKPKVKTNFLVGHGKSENLRKVLEDGKAEGKLANQLLAFMDIDDNNEI